MSDHISKQIIKKVNEILEDDSLGAAGKKFDHDHHVDLKTKMLELLEEDVPNLVDETTRLEGEAARLREAIVLIEDESSHDDACITQINGIARDALNAQGDTEPVGAQKKMDHMDADLLRVIYNRYDAATLIAAIKKFNREEPT